MWLWMFLLNDDEEKLFILILHKSKLLFVLAPVVKCIHTYNISFLFVLFSLISFAMLHCVAGLVKKQTKTTTKQ